MGMDIRCGTETCEAPIPWQTPTEVTNEIVASDTPLDVFVAYFKKLWPDGDMDEDIERARVRIQAYLDTHPNAEWYGG